MIPDFVALWDTYKDKIEAYVYRRTSDPHLAEDLAALTIVKVIEAFQQGNGPRTSESGWVYRIAHNLVIDHYRKRDRQKIADLEPSLVERGHSPAEWAEIQLDIDTVGGALHRLTDEQVKVITLRYIHGYAFAEIAAEMGKTEGAIKALQHRGLETLRGMLAERLSA